MLNTISKVGLWCDILLGNIVPPEHFEKKKLNSRTEIWTWVEDNLKHELTIGIKEGKLVTYTISLEGAPELQVDYERWGEDGFLEELKIVLPQRQITLALRLRDLYKNLDFSPNIFKLRVPEGMAEERW